MRNKQSVNENSDMNAAKEKTPSNAQRLGNRRFFLFGVLPAVAIIAIGFVFAYFTYQAHMEKTRQIEEETAKLLEELYELECKRETLEDMIEYSESEEYLIRYAREHLGYMLEGDIRFDVNDPDRPIPTAELPLVTARPTAVPTVSIDPANTPAPTDTPEPIETTEPGDE